MSRHFKLIKNWADKFNYTPTPSNLKLLSPEKAELCFNLIKEELKETIEAWEQGDLIGFADGILDLKWVVDILACESGINEEQLEELFYELHRSNSSKACKNPEEALATQKYYKETKGVNSQIIHKEGEYFVYRSPDNKLLKSINYLPVDFKSIINKYKTE